MKKAISFVLTVLMLCFATSAMAATMGSVSGNRNSSDITAFNTTYNGTGGRSITMPTFRPDDVLSFNLTALTADKQLTVVSYKYNESFSDATVQYINQYTVSAAEQSNGETITYTIRDKSSGIYMLKINDSVDTVATFYYKVGRTTATTVHNAELAPDNATAYRIVEFADGWSIGFIGKITIDSADVRFGEIAAKPGFKLTGGNIDNDFPSGYVSNGIDGADLDTFMEDLITANNVEINGSYSVIYGMTLYKVPEEDIGDIVATAAVDAN